MKKDIKCPKCKSQLKETLTQKGVLIDVCSSCKGVWLDPGELNFFVQDKKLLRDYEKNGLKEPYKVPFECPKCPSSMQVGLLPGLPFRVEECLACGGLFLDAPEFEKFHKRKEFKALQPDRLFSSAKKPNKKKFSALPVKIPSLFFTTGVVCFGLYGLLLAGVIFLIEINTLSLLQGVGGLLLFVLAQFYFSPITLDWQLRLLGSLKWVDPDQLPTHFKDSLLKLCDKNNIPLPKMGIIEDGSPQAYTYGRTPYSARVVFSRGMFDLLDAEEAEAVLAHELGHIKHWDFLVMTVIQVVPILLYTIYRNIKYYLESSDSKNDKGKAPLAIAMVVSYIFYLISEYMVLFVSRVREYYADRFSAFATQKPNKLLTALVKISYGLLSAQPSSSDSEEDSQTHSYQDKIKGVETLNIMSVARSKQLALASQGKEQALNPQTVQEIMRWDLWSPWAFYYELHSTHPLTAKRINALGSYALSLKQKPFLLFDHEKPESYWDDFLSDIFVLSLPYILGIGGVLSYLWFADYNLSHFIALISSAGAEEEGVSLQHIKPLISVGVAGILGLSLGAFIRLASAYPFYGFSRYSVASLLKLIKVSPVKSYPVTLTGYILGRGEAGNIFSEDLVLRDQTGLIYLNHEPFGLNILFALFRYKKFQGKKVTVKGWYRRSPSPYVEVKNIKTSDTHSTAYTFHYKLIFCAIGILIPLIYFFLT